MTKELFNDDAYRQECSATVTEITERGGIILDQTIFYATGGGQSGDRGQLVWQDGQTEIATTVKDRESGQHIHVPAEGGTLPKVGDTVTCKIDWDNRYLHMRMHTALHLMCIVVPCGVTGGQIGAIKSRLDFDVGDYQLDKEQITEKLNALVDKACDLSSRWITEEELDDNKDLVRTMSVQPPRGKGTIRLVSVGDDVDLQPCGGTHVRNTSEIGQLRVSKIQSKGKKNRRVHIVFADA